jgi:hypothetical protein
MFATYDYTNFPEVKVIFNGSIQDESDYILFTEQWLKLYEDKNNFNFLFDMKDIGMVNLTYCYKIASFISDIKSREIQYLTESTIINVNDFSYGLLQLVFMIQSPISKVTIIKKDDVKSVIYP